MLTKQLYKPGIYANLSLVALLSIALSSCGDRNYIPGGKGFSLPKEGVKVVNITATKSGRSEALYIAFNHFEIPSSTPVNGKFLVEGLVIPSVEVEVIPSTSPNAYVNLTTPCARGFLPQGTPFEVKVVLYDAQGEAVAQQSGQLQVNCTYHQGLL